MLGSFQDHSLSILRVPYVVQLAMMSGPEAKVRQEEYGGLNIVIEAKELCTVW